MTVTDSEKALLEKRKSADLTPREFLLVTELQTRLVIDTLPEGPAKAQMSAECEGLRNEVETADFNTATMGYLNGLGQRLVKLNGQAAALMPRKA